MHYQYPELTSTNTEAARLDNERPLAHGDTVSCHTQSAGRGQRGNTWESAPGENLTMSILLRPEGIRPAEQFTVSEAVALAVVDLLADNGITAEVKWPNDIYVGNRKICGILIENVITTTAITRSIAGIGLNVNQTRFISDAPNPVSMKQLTGVTYDLDRLRDALAGIVLRNLNERPSLHCRYMSALWRRNGYHLYAEPGSAPFPAAIAAIAPTGHITLKTPDGTPKTYAFKEISAIL